MLHPPNSSDLAVLVGNGLSIAYNADLAVPRLYAHLNSKISAGAANFGRTELALQTLSQEGRTGDPGTDFEVLLGRIERHRAQSADLAALAHLSPYQDHVTESVQVTRDFADLVHRHGVSYVLEAISEGSRIDHHELAGIQSFLDGVVYAAGGGRVTIGSLNYDPLLTGALSTSHRGEFCDMVDGRGALRVQLTDDGFTSTAQVLRTRPGSFPDRPIRLLQLHGALTWMRHVLGGAVIRVPIADLRDSGFWAALRAGTTQWRPQVVLTGQDQKYAITRQEPFDLAYKMFGQALGTTSRWLIVGYGFRDGCVNEMLRARYEQWAQVGMRPQVLVVTYGDSPSLGEVAAALGERSWTPEQFIGVYRGGVQNLLGSREWAAWNGFTPGNFSLAS